MSFAYIPGHEQEALVAFENRLKAATDPQELRELEYIISKLREIVREQAPAINPESHGSMSLSYCPA